MENRLLVATVEELIAKRLEMLEQLKALKTSVRWSMSDIRRVEKLIKLKGGDCEFGL